MVEVQKRQAHQRWKTVLREKKKGAGGGGGGGNNFDAIQASPSISFYPGI